MKLSTALIQSREYTRLVYHPDGWSVLYFPLPWETHDAILGGDIGRPWMEARLDQARARAEVALQLLEHDRTGKAPEEGKIGAAVYHAIDNRGLTRLDDIVAEARRHLEG